MQCTDISRRRGMIWKAEILAILSRHGGNIREHFEMWTRCSHQSELLSSTYLVLFMLLLLFCLKNISIPLQDFPLSSRNFCIGIFLGNNATCFNQLEKDVISTQYLYYLLKSFLKIPVGSYLQR